MKAHRRVVAFGWGRQQAEDRERYLCGPAVCVMIILIYASVLLLHFGINGNRALKKTCSHYHKLIRMAIATSPEMAEKRNHLV